MIVEITHAHESQNFPKIGEFYKVRQYGPDPDKVTLLYKVDPITHEKTEHQYWGDDPVCNEYKENCRKVTK